jgi:putative transposase
MSINDTWSIDIIHNQLWDVRSIRLYRENLGMEYDFPLRAARLVWLLDQIIKWRGQAMTICCDNGPEYISLTMGALVENRGTQIRFIQSGKT